MANEFEEIARKYFRSTMESLVDLTPEQQAVVLKILMDGLVASLMTFRGEEETAAFLERMAGRIRCDAKLN